MEYKMTAEEEKQMVEAAFKNLLDGYLASNHRKKVEIIEKAYKFACEAHKGIRRRSGEPYILHPIAVATIVSQEIGLGSTSICAALLHDVVEDTDYTVEDLEAQFGKKIANIVEGLTKISGGIFGDKASVQAENFRKLLLTMSNDIRVVLIKMADRLHNMRTLGSMLPSKQYKIAGETLYIYAPLAHRLGLFAIKTELEDLSFKYEHPDTYENIKRQIADSEEARNKIFDKFATPIRAKLDAMGLQYDMKARVKSVYSIWNKMETKHVSFNEVYDLYAARIVFKCDRECDEKRICWNIYSEITDLYSLHPDRTRDWISVPKANGYRALHLTVMGPDGNWVEVQIRSERMDEMAEKGFAAHWKYKIGEGEEETELRTWLMTIEEILSNPEPNALDFLDTIKLNLFASEIVVFTPKGELMTMPKDATVLDMAFNLHSELGMHCIAGKVNHKLVSLSHKLQSGDQVEILTSRSQTAKAEWEKFVVTATGKSRLRQALRKQRRNIVDKGTGILDKFLAEHNVAMTGDVINRIISKLKLQNKDELLYKLGCGEVKLEGEHLKDAKISSAGNLLSKIFSFGGGKKSKEEPKSITKKVERVNGKIDISKVYVLTSENGVSNYKLAGCCNPIPGDDVVGYVNDNDEVVVHKLSCENAMRLKSSYGGRLLQTNWDSLSEKFLVAVNIEGVDRMGILQEIIYTISTTLAIDIRNLQIGAQDGLFTSHLDVMVKDATVVNNLCKRLRSIKGVTAATRKN
ncbi:MAG: bifunctional (p)ppGpp synthetase/guanosine-3',5'-bis(diphosphate) 3'-pyrophosphohydrolase [Bacteroidales bacterium]|nr:bifunctional (p)ppGpp synthetase/guanosine-3',5'-bis(diphosphate) 3'-pyrophosphohydrolase [Bacteroidales bacterium]